MLCVTGLRYHRVATLLVFATLLAGCDGCRANRNSETSPGSPLASVSASVVSIPAVAVTSPAEESGVAHGARNKVGSASVNGSAAAAPTDLPVGYRHVSTFVVRVALAYPGQAVTLELVDRVATGADADDAHRILRLRVIAGKETTSGALSIFAGDAADSNVAAPRRVRLVFGGETVEVAVPAAHLPSRRFRASVMSLSNPVLHPDTWSALLFYAQTKDERGLDVTILEPPELRIGEQRYLYPDWPEPGWLWRVRVDAL